MVFFKNIRFPHSHRGEKQSGISESNMDFLDNIVGLKRNKFLLGFDLPKNNSNLKIMSRGDVINFMQTYQRITQNMLKQMPKYASVILKLNNNHQIKSAVYKIK